MAYFPRFCIFRVFPQIVVWYCILFLYIDGGRKGVVVIMVVVVIFVVVVVVVVVDVVVVVEVVYSRYYIGKVGKPSQTHIYCSRNRNRRRNAKRNRNRNIKIDIENREYDT